MWKRLLWILPLFVLLSFGQAFETAVARTRYEKNGSFEFDADHDGVPDDWRGHNLGPDDTIVPDPYVGVYSFRMVGERGVNKALRQTIRVDLPRGTLMTFVAKAKTDHEDRTGGLYALKIVLLYGSGKGETILLKFKPRSDWQSRGFHRVLRGRLRTMTISVIYNDQIGQAWFDDIQVYSDL